MQKSIAFGLRRDREHLLELIDRQQHRGAAGVAGAQILEQLLDVIDGDRGAERLLPGAPFVRLAEVLRDRLGEHLHRRFSRANGRQHHPFAAAPGQLRQHAGLEQRRFPGARCADHHQEARSALGAARVQPFDQRPALVVAAEIDGGVLGLERMNTRIRRPVRIEREAARQFAGDGAQPLLHPLETALLPIDEIDRLHLGQHEALAERLDDDRQDDLAERARLRELDTAPGGGEPVRRQHQDDGVAARQLVVEPLLPVLAGADPGFLVEIEKDPLKAEPGQRRLDVVGVLLVEARMADEDSGHVPLRCSIGLHRSVGDDGASDGSTASPPVTVDGFHVECKHGNP